jgi:hypothetical protein
MSQPTLTIITHNVGYSEIISGYGSLKWHPQTIAKFRVMPGERTYPEWKKRHDEIVQKVYRMRTAAVRGYLKKQKDVELID